MAWDDLMGEQQFKPVAAYRRSKIANLLHSLELHRRLSDSDGPGTSDTAAIAAHPGIAASAFWENTAGPNLRWAARAADAGIAVVFSTAAQGAVPVVHAAAADDVVSGALLRPAHRPTLGSAGAGRARRRTLAMPTPLDDCGRSPRN